MLSALWIAVRRAFLHKEKPLTIAVVKGSGLFSPRGHFLRELSQNSNNAVRILTSKGARNTVRML